MMLSSRVMPQSPRLCRLPVPTRTQAARYSNDKYLASVKQRSQFPNQATVNNLKLTKDTRVIFQGFTGKQATFDAQHSMEYGTNIVGGVRPNKDGEHLGKPVVPNMREAMKHLKPDATAVYVAASHAASAIEEAIESEIPLVVAVAEHVPVHDMLRIQQILRTQTKTRLVGANTPGMINPHAKCRIGFPPIPFFKPGNIAIAAKSGTLSYETVASTTRAGLGQSMSIGIGGDPIPGTDFVDCLKIFEEDPNTEGIILVGELGGFTEEHAAEWIRDYRQRVANPKPIAAIIGGISAPVGRVMGHAGSMSGLGEPTALEKIKHLEDVGVVVTDHPAKFGDLMKDLLAKRPSGGSQAAGTPGQKRSFHTLARRRPQTHSIKPVPAPPHPSHRNIWLTREQSMEHLKKNGVPISENMPTNDGEQHKFAIAIDRHDKNLRVIGYEKDGQITAVPFDLSTTSTSDKDFTKVVEELLSRVQPAGGLSRHIEVDIFQKMRKIFAEAEAKELHFTVCSSLSDGAPWTVTAADLRLDNPAFRVCGRREELHAQRRADLEDAGEVAAERFGIVYVRLAGEEDARIGTVANGAGLAMNLVDAVQARGGRCTNFLDTGGKATSETVKESFRTVLADPRVRVVFVNIFGGLTLGDMIARGVLLAYTELDIRLPVVVRIRGTNEEEGQRIIADSGLPMHAFHDFEEAAAKAIELANEGREQ